MAIRNLMRRPLPGEWGTFSHPVPPTRQYDIPSPPPNRGWVPLVPPLRENESDATMANGNLCNKNNPTLNPDAHADDKDKDIDKVDNLAQATTKLEPA